MSKIHLIDGEKGGVGKSFFAKTLIEYFLNQKIPYTLIDADQTNPDVHQLYPEGAQMTVFSDVEKKSHHADLIFESALKNSVIVNLPAQISNLVKGWIERSNILEVGCENDVQICKWFISSGDFSSINLFKESVAYYQDRIVHILVKNMGLMDDWEFLKDDPDLTNLFTKYPQTLKSIEFAKCTYKERYDLEKLQMTLSGALKSNKFSILPKQRLMNFKKASFAAIEKTSLIEKEEEVSSSTSGEKAKSKRNNSKKNSSRSNKSQPPVPEPTVPIVNEEELVESNF